jgi:hypothetical protein
VERRKKILQKFYYKRLNGEGAYSMSRKLTCGSQRLLKPKGELACAVGESAKGSPGSVPVIDPCCLGACNIRSWP